MKSKNSTDSPLSTFSTYFQPERCKQRSLDASGGRGVIAPTIGEQLLMVQRKAERNNVRGMKKQKHLKLTFFPIDWCICHQGREAPNSKAICRLGGNDDFGGCTSTSIEKIVLREHHKTAQQPTSSHLFSSGGNSISAVVVAV